MSASIETGKEILRLVIFAAIAAGITALIEYFTNVPDTTVAAIILLILRAADKYIHKSDLDHNGILPF